MSESEDWSDSGSSSDISTENENYVSDSESESESGSDWDTPPFPELHNNTGRNFVFDETCGPIDAPPADARLLFLMIFLPKKKLIIY